MNQIEYKIIPPTEEAIKELETMRYNAYSMKPLAPNTYETFYSRELKDNKYLIFGCYLNNQLAAACYTSKLYNSLYIDQLFTLKKYQKTGLYLGKNLLLHILANKEIAEEFFQTTFNYSYLDDYKGTSNFYQSLGYRHTNQLMRKKI